LQEAPYPDNQEVRAVTDWDRIVREHGPRVFATAWRILGHAADAEDVVQEVFLQAHRMGQAGAVRSWGGLLRRLAACRALDRLRRRRPTVELDELALACDADGPEEIAIEHELAERLRQSLAHLPPREATVFCLRYFDDLPYEKIAESLQITTGAAAVALHKARTRLEALLLQPVAGESHDGTIA
jgi:RNA polymerase sigma-70 factor (ECF subfamily)